MAEPAVQLAQRLAANDKKSRDRALRKLRRFMSARSSESEGGFTADEFCKIWKGLFYCMWMQDKPLLQEELAVTMSQLVHALKSHPSQNLFIRSFWQTLNREWNGIDRLRLDKFYTLSRFVLRQSVELLKKGDWEESLVENFLTVLVDEVLKPEAPQGVQHHLIDIYLDELAKVGSSELPADLNLKLIEPFCRIAAKAKNFLLRQSVVTGIFQAILEQSPFAIEDLMKEVGHTAADNDNSSESEDHHTEDCDDIGPVLQFDYQALADRLFNLASRKNVPPRNRKSLYRLVKRFKDLADGIFPQDGGPEDVSSGEDDDDTNSSGLRRRQKKAQEKMAQSSRVTHNEKGKRPRAAETPENSPDTPVAKKKRKKKGEADRPEINGTTLHHQHITKETDVGFSQSPPEASESSSAIARLRRRRRGCLIRLGLSILPLRGAIIMRRRRLIRERRKISGKAANVVTSECPAPASSAHVHSTSSAHVHSTSSAHAPPTPRDFITFQKSKAPKPLYVKGSKSKGQTISKSKSKKVTFSLNRNMTAEFKRTDRSLLVSPAGSSRVPFNPSQRPQHGVLKTPTPPKSAARRATASDFF
ncbi:ribosomal RNA processing protein 1 homolog A-like [Anomaloglossus baeobatrachus]|uniref:ribosomal RNA processing protein 1 homolog A-like n=1 Tax=Anomaloglossus baeobatrachus TaxID=238106 RepID=UPI003F504FBF